MTFKKRLLASSLLLASTQTLASNWVIINVGDINTVIPNPQVEQLIASATQSGTNLSVELGNTANTEAYYYQRVEIINGVEVNHGWQCQTGTTVAANGNKLIDKTSFTGQYKYNVAACMTGNGCDVDAYQSGELICSDTESTATVNFSGANPTGTVNTLPSSEFRGKNEHVGTVGGEFRVSESGAATYNIPIAVPQGTAGVTPQLGLSYNSQGGDGFLGRGWNISGTSAISRCPKTRVQDDIIGGVTGTQSDRLCYNGQRLIKKGERTSSDSTYWSATQYVTEIDSFAIFHRIDDYAFVMETKSGEHHLFGDINQISTSSVDSIGVKFRPNAFKLRDKYGSVTTNNTKDGEVTTGTNNTGISMTWMLKAIKDIKQNYILFDYDGNQQNLREVHYTGNLTQDNAPYAKVKFNYEVNKKPSIGYRYGRVSKMSQLLDSVTVSIDQKTYRHYDLNYITSNYAEEFNYLVSIEECVDTAKTNCNKPVTFNWLKPAPVSTTEGSCTIIPADDNHKSCTPSSTDPFKGFFDTNSTINAVHDNLQIFDMDGDGYSDFVYTRSGKWMIKRGPSFATEETIYSGLDDKAEYALNMDYNGDGVRDLLVANSITSNWYALTYEKRDAIKDKLVCQGGFNRDPSKCTMVPTTIAVNDIPTGVVASYLEGQSLVADIDGDTLEDLVQFAGNAVTVRKNSKSGFVQGEAGLKTLLTLPTGQIVKAIAKDKEKKNANLISSAAVDFNGDGVTDIALNVDYYTGRCKGYATDDDGTQITGWLDTITTKTACDSYQPKNQYDYQTTQWITSIQYNKWHFYFGQVDASGVRLKSTPAIILNGIKNPQFPDLNGDGLSDLFYQVGNNWRYRISTGTSFNAEKTTSFTTSDSNEHLLSVIDLNTDGRSDIMYPRDVGSVRHWNQYITIPNMSDPSKVDFILRGNYPLATKNTQVRFAELNGDAHLDLLQLKDGKWRKHLGTSIGSPRHVIKEITTGFGVKTNINYASLMTSGVYVNDATPYVDPSNYPGNFDQVESSDLFSPKGGMYVVGAVSTNTGPTTSTWVGYQYSGLLMNKQGRGSLGFYSLKTTDYGTCDSTIIFTNELGPDGELVHGERVAETTDNCVTTESFYSQEFPYVGMPIRTVQKRGTKTLSDSKNELHYISTADGAIFPYIKKTNETSYGLSDTFATQYTLGHIQSEFVYDEYGNLENSTVYSSSSSTPSTGSNRHVTETTNTYRDGDSDKYKRKGRLETVTAKKSVYKNGSAISSSTRKTQFEYYNRTDDASMMLKKEIISPNDSKYKSEKIYEYDVWGNKVKETADSPAMAEQRHSITTFDSRGRLPFSTNSYVESDVNNAFVTNYSYNNKTSGSITGLISTSKVTDLNGAYVISDFDAWGTKTNSQAYDATGKSMSGGADNQTITAYCSNISGCPSDAYYAMHVFAPGAPEKIAYFDAWGREIQTKVLTLSGWSYTDTQYNAQGKPWKVSEPYFSGQTKYWNETFYDKLRRVDYTKQAAGGETNVSYQGLTTVTTDAEGQTKTSTKDFAGNLVKVKDHYNKELIYTYDAYGNLLTAKVNGKVQVTNAYDAYGRKDTTNDLDKGFWDYDYNALGQLIYQKTARGHITRLYYDDLGRKERRVDHEGTTCWRYGKATDANYSTGKLVEIRQYNSSLATCPGVSNSSHKYAESYVYASNGKVQTRAVTFEGKEYASHTFFDDYSRVRNVVYPRMGMSVRNEYKNGYLYKVFNNASNDADYGKLLKHISAVNARGQATTVSYANGAVENRDFWDETGLAYTFNVTGSNWHNHQTYTFNNVGTLTDRAMDVRSAAGTKSFNEHFDYDDLSRVKSRTLTGSAFSGFNMNESFTYDALGNLKTKTGISGSYVYDTTRPNRLTSVDGRTFKYDANGNVYDDGERTHTYASFDKPTLIANKAGTVKAEFSYGPNREVLKKKDTINGKVTSTLYMGGYEQVEKDTGLIEHKFYVGNIVITRRNDDRNDTYFLHKDHLGSTIAISDMGRREAKMFMYDTFGKQYQIYSNNSLYMPHNLGIDRGYTGHKMLNELGIIHMNGRIYDPTLGRFLQADPHVQAPSNLQNYNRYSYVLNNPMSYTDPSGYFFKKLASFVKKYWKVAAMAYISWATGNWAHGLELFAGNAVAAGAAAGAISGFITGAVATGSLKGALQGAVTGAIFGAIGGKIHAAEAAGKAWKVGEQMLAHAMAGGILSVLKGGKFGHGFVNAGIMKGVGKIGTADAWGRVTIQAIAGGTLSELTGGKFANGAITAAIQMTVNENAQEITDFYRSFGIFTAGDKGAWGEIRSHAVKGKDEGFASPEGLADAKASIEAACERNGVCADGDDGADATAYADKKAWQNIINADGGTDQSGGGNLMCVGHQNCTFVHSAYERTENGSVLTQRPAPLDVTGTVTIHGTQNGDLTLYFYDMPHKGWMTREDYLGI